jgi:hypothetical protein
MELRIQETGSVLYYFPKVSDNARKILQIVTHIIFPSCSYYETSAKQRGGDASVAGIVRFSGVITPSPERRGVDSTLLQRSQFVRAFEKIL